MQKICLPKKIYFKEGSTEVALRELKEIYHIKSVLIVTSAATYVGGAGAKVMRYLQKLGIRTSNLFLEEEGVTVQDLEESCTMLWEFEPEAIVAVGNATILGAGKIIKLLRLFPELSVEKLLGTLEKGELREEVEAKKQLQSGKQEEILSVMIPTSFAEGGQNTPFAEIICNETGEAVCYKDTELLADISITDIQLVEELTPERIQADGSVLMEKCQAALEEGCSEYLEGFLREAIHAVELYQAEGAAGSLYALEKLHYAGSIAGNALGNI